MIHGGPYQAVLQYAVHHYDTWRAEFPDIAARFGPGGFGENIVAAIFDETNLCIGDTLRLGGALVCVTQSRQPCYKLNPSVDQRSSVIRSELARDTQAIRKRRRSVDDRK